MNYIQKNEKEKIIVTDNIKKEEENNPNNKDGKIIKEEEKTIIIENTNIVEKREKTIDTIISEHDFNVSENDIFDELKDFEIDVDITDTLPFEIINKNTDLVPSIATTLEGKLAEQIKAYGTTLIDYGPRKDPYEHIVIKPSNIKHKTNEDKIEELLGYKLNLKERYDNMLKQIESKYPNHFTYIIEQETINKNNPGSTAHLNPNIINNQTLTFTYYKQDNRNTKHLNEAEHTIATMTPLNVESYIRTSFYPTYQPSKQRIIYDFLWEYLNINHTYTKKNNIL